MKTCAICKNPLSAKQIKQGAAYCSCQCQHASMRSNVMCICKWCGSAYHPKAKDRISYCSRECYQAFKRAEKCAADAEKEHARIKVMAERAEQHAAKKNAREIADRLSRERACEECGVHFAAAHKSRIYCSVACARRAGRRVERVRRRCNMGKNGAISKGISLEKLIKRDGNICHICGGACDRADSTTDTNGYFIAGGKYPSIDHVWPLSLGGTHTWSNVKLAHCICNSIKCDSVSDQASG